MNPNNQTQLEEIWGWQGKIRTIADRAKHILGKDILSDVTFRVVPSNGNPTVDIKAHKFLLAMGTEVFETMFYGSLTEDTGVVQILDIDPEPFRLLLRYIYHDQIGPFDKSTAFATLYAAKKYGIPILKHACDENLKTNVATDNCLTWFVQAQSYDEPNLASFCLEKVDLWGSSVLQSVDFLNISLDVLKQILRRDTLKVKEADVCNAVIKWATVRCNKKKVPCAGSNFRSDLGEALFLVRFPIMTSQEVAAGPAKSGLLLSDENGWYHDNADGSSDVIAFQVSSNSNTSHSRSITISLSAIGLYLPNPLSVGKQCTATMKIYEGSGQELTHGSWRKAGVTRHLKDKVEFQSFSNAWTFPTVATESNIAKFKLSKALPVKEGLLYTISVQEIGQSVYGTGGKQSVTARAENHNITVQFFDAPDPAYGQGAYHGNSYGSTAVFQGQLPEFYFEVTE